MEDLYNVIRSIKTKRLYRSPVFSSIPVGYILFQKAPIDDKYWALERHL